MEKIYRLAAGFGLILLLWTATLTGSGMGMGLGLEAATGAAQGSLAATVDLWPLPVPDALPAGIDVDPQTGEVFVTMFNYGLGQLDPATNGFTYWQVGGGPNRLELCRCSGDALYAVFTQALSDQIGLLLSPAGWYRTASDTAPGGFAQGLDVVQIAGTVEIWYAERLGGRVGFLQPQPGDFDPRSFRSTPDSGQTLTPQAVPVTATVVPTITLLTPGNPALPPAAVSVPADAAGAVIAWDFSPVYGGDVLLEDIAVGPSGEVWVANSAQPLLVQLDVLSSTASLYTLPPNSVAVDLAVDPARGYVWFTEGYQSKIGMLDPTTGDVHEWDLPTPGQPVAIALDGTGELVWFADREGNRIGVLDWINNEITLYPLPPDSYPVDLAVDANGDAWFVAERGNYIGRIVRAAVGPPPGPVADADIDVVPTIVNFGNVPLGSASAQLVTVRNVGGAPLTITDLTVTPSPPFALGGARGIGAVLVLQPGESYTLTVEFRPAIAGAASGALQIASNDPDEGVVTVLLSGTGVTTAPPPPPPPPGTGEIVLRADRGCGAAGAPYSFGDLITLTMQVNEAGTGVLYDFAPEGRLKGIPLGTFSPGVPRTLTAQIVATQGVETFVLQVTTVSGRTLAVGCSVSIGGTPTSSVQITTDRGCDAIFSVGERLTMNYGVAFPVSRVRIFLVAPAQRIAELTPVPLTTPTGSISGTVGPPSGDRVLVAVAVAQTGMVASAHCRYRVP